MKIRPTYCPACRAMTTPTTEDAPSTHCSECNSGYPCGIGEHHDAHFLTLAEIMTGCRRPAPVPPFSYLATPDPTGLRPEATDAERDAHYARNIIADQEERDRDAAPRCVYCGKTYTAGTECRWSDSRQHKAQTR